MSTIIVGLSGGVDSSVAAALLREAGHDVVGVTLRTTPWEASEEPSTRFGSCCSPTAAGAARQVARRLGIPYYLLNHEREFGDRVIDDFTREYGAGRTPSPCVVCNREIKFGTLLQRALAWEAEAVATGHYARVAPDPRTGRVCLLTAQRPGEGPELLPLAADAGAAGAGSLSGGRPDASPRCEPGRAPEASRRRRLRKVRSSASSTETTVRFCAGGPRRRFAPGLVLDESGREIGEHAGLGGYTVGQRRGLGRLGSAPAYVLRLDPSRNAVVVGPREALRATRLVAEQVNWIAVTSLEASLEVEARVRHRAPRVAARVRPLDGARVEITLERTAIRDHTGPVSRALPRRGSRRWRRDRQRRLTPFRARVVSPKGLLAPFFTTSPPREA